MSDETNIYNHLPPLSGKPFITPSDYFDNITQKITDRIADDSVLSHVLTGISKKPPYSVPADYFSNFSSEKKYIPKRATGQATIRKLKYGWQHFIAAATTIGIIALTSLLFYTHYLQQKNENSSERFSQQHLKMMPTNQLNGFLNDPENNMPANTAIYEPEKHPKANDGDRLFNKVSDAELKIFLDETGDADDAFQTN